MNPTPFDPKIASFIKRLFQEYDKSIYSFPELAKMADEWGYKTPTGKTMYAQYTERIIGDALFYVGSIANPFATPDDPENIQLVPAKHTPLISREDAIKALQIKSGKSVNATRRLRYNPDFPLRKAVLCSGSKTLSFRTEFHTTKGQSFEPLNWV